MQDHEKLKEGPKGLLIGWSKPIVTRSIGFGATENVISKGGRPVMYDGEGHLMTIAPTGAGKGVGCVVPAILKHDGPVVVMDLKAENYAMTRRHRAQTGSKVVCIDPFGAAARVAGRNGEDLRGEITGFNPFDLLPYLSDDRDTACRALAEMILTPEPFSREPFWQEAAITFTAALIACYDRLPGAQRSISAIVNDLSIELPKRGHIGTIPAEINALSALTSDVDLVDEMAKYEITPQAALLALHEAKENQGDITWRSDMEDVVERVAVEVLKRERSSIGHGAALLEARAILGEMKKQEPTYDRFKQEIIYLSYATDEQEDLIRRLWDLLSKVRGLVGMSGDLGSFAYSDPCRPSPENYPLAIHRLALDGNQMCRSAASQPLTTDRTWGAILCIVRAELGVYSGRSLGKCLGGSNSLDLEAIRRGDDISLYIAFPPDRIRSHAGLFRVMVEGLLAVIVSRSERPEKRTLLLLDEVAQLGRINLLITAKTLLRGYGVQVWSFWQDISQIVTHYPHDWQTIMNNCRVIQVFGRGAGVMTSDLARALDVHPGMIASLADEDMLAWVDSRQPGVLRRPVCYRDPVFRNLCDDGPFALPAKPKLEAGIPDALSQDEIEAPAAKPLRRKHPRKRKALLASSGA